MTELRACEECRRHVSIEESACPFCGAARVAESAQASRFSRASRAAVFAGAVLATAACGGSKPKASDSNIQNTDTQQADADAGVVELIPPDDPHPHRDPSNIPMPYGAPPARGRMV
jgi:hypothetical protein